LSEADVELNIKEIEEAAKREIAEEMRRAAINAAKERISRAKWWHKFVPFQIQIIRRK
jgi:hypothetical protein